MFKIEKGIEIPEVATTKQGRAAKYPFRTMEIGDSIFIEDVADIRKAKNVFTQLNSRYKKAGEPNRFVSADVDGGVRIWRNK